MMPMRVRKDQLPYLCWDVVDNLHISRVNLLIVCCVISVLNKEGQAIHLSTVGVRLLLGNNWGRKQTETRCKQWGPPGTR
jgi:hypothetical protein